MTPADPAARAALADRLRAAGCVFAEDEAAVLMSSAVSPGELEAMVRRRVGGEPLEQVVGWAELCGLRIAVRPGVFVPRRRSELLVQESIRVAPEGAVVVELCCGAAGIARAVAEARPDVELHAADVDPAAVACASDNLDGLGEVHLGDLYEALPSSLRGRVDVLVANAPYVPSDAIALLPPEARLHEPRAALDGGADGLDVQRGVAAGAASWLRPGGWLLIETGRHQAPSTEAIVAATGLTASTVTDDDLDATVVIGRRPALRA